MSNSQTRTAAFAAALTFFVDTTKQQIGAEDPKGPARQSIEFVKALGGGEPPATIVALADAEDSVLKLTREVQQAQQAIIVALLGNGEVYPDDSEVDGLVASLNNLKDAIDVANAAKAAFDADAAADTSPFPNDDVLDAARYPLQ